MLSGDIGPQGPPSEWRRLADDLVPVLSSRRPPSVDGLDRAGWDACAARGLFRSILPKTEGGLGLPPRDVARVFEVIGYHSRESGFVLALSVQVWSVVRLLQVFGSTDLKSRLLLDLAKGTVIGAHAATEEGSGSDFGSIQFAASPTGGGIRLDGTKVYVTNLPEAGLVLVYARESSASSSVPISLFAVETDRPGVTTESMGSRIGYRGGSMGLLRCEGVRIPAGNRIGTVGAGSLIFQACMEWERSYMLAHVAGALRRQLDDCLHFLRHRKRQGRTLTVHQSVVHEVARLYVRLLSTRALLDFTMSAKDGDRRAPLECAATKLVVAESWLASSLASARLRGAQGQLVSAGVGWDVGDALGALSSGGACEVQLDVIGRLLLASEDRVG